MYRERKAYNIKLHTQQWLLVLFLAILIHEDILIFFTFATQLFVCFSFTAIHRANDSFHRASAYDFEFRIADRCVLSQSTFSVFQ